MQSTQTHKNEEDKLVYLEIMCKDETEHFLKDLKLKVCKD